MLAKNPIGWCTEVMKQLTPGEKLLAALELQELGLQMKKTQIRRNNPDATAEDIHQLFRNWLLAREPIPDGFRIVSWPLVSRRIQLDNSAQNEIKTG